MNIRPAIRFSRSVIVGLALAIALAAPAAASPSSSVPVDPPAIPGVPDVGARGEKVGRQTEPTIDPHGNPVWPSDSPPARGGVIRTGWTYVVGVVDGARIRTRPVDGKVIGLIPYGAYYWIACQVRGSDSYLWGYANHDNRYGWVREDLWDVVHFTAPNAPAPRPIPWC